MGSNRISVSGGFCIMAALLLLLVPLKWLFAAAVAALWHECCHYFAIRLLSRESANLSIYSYASHLSLPRMTQGREVLAALAGPVGGLCLLLLARWIPRIALCAAMQSIYNLLPVYPLDGGRAFKSGMLLLISPPKAYRVCRITTQVCKLSIIMLAFYGCLWLRMGIFPVLIALLWLIRIK